MERIDTEEAVKLARDIAIAITDGIDRVNAKSKESPPAPMMSREQFIEEMTVEMGKLIMHKFVVTAISS
jgi:hypothetical protein